MLVLGLILILVAALALVAAIAGGADDQAQFNAGSLHVDMSTMSAFLIGAATLLVFVCGLELARSGARRSRQRRQRTRQLNRAASARAQGADHDPNLGEPSPDDPGDTSTRR